MYKKILVPLDGSELAECELKHAGNMVKEGYAGEITLFNVVKVDSRWDELYVHNFDINAMKEALFASRGEYLTNIKTRLNSEDIKVNTVSVAAESPAYKITEYAKGNGMELIIMRTHGYTGLKRMMMGSVALRVLHESHIPVLLLSNFKSYSEGRNLAGHREDTSSKNNSRKRPEKQ